MSFFRRLSRFTHCGLPSYIDTAANDAERLACRVQKQINLSTKVKVEKWRMRTGSVV